MGAAALAGTSYPLDREFTAELLGFARPSANSLDAVSDRDFAAEYGFIVRYTPENTAVTGFSPESWHLRYVGRPLAAAMTNTAVTTLEQVFGVDGGADYR